MSFVDPAGKRAGRAGFLGRQQSLALAAAGVAFLFAASPRANAGGATWTGAGDGSWSNAANWSPASPPGSASSTTSPDVATFNNAGNGHTTVTVDSNRNVSGITFDTSSASAYTFNGGPLLLSSGGMIQMTPTVTTAQTFNVPIQIEGSSGTYSFINNASNANATLDLTGLLAPVIPTSSFQTTTITLGGSNTGANTVSGAIADSVASANGSRETAALNKTGTGTWVLSGSDTYGGLTDVFGGTLVIAGTLTAGNQLVDFASVQLTGNYGKSNLLAASGGLLNINGNGQLTSGATMGIGGTATIDNAALYVPNRLNGANVGMGGGLLNYISSNGNNAESIGTLFPSEGANTIVLTPNPVGSTVVSIATLNGNATGTSTTAGTLLLTGRNLGGAPGANTTNFVAASTTAAAAPIGGGGAAGTNDISIENFVLARDLALSGNAQYGFVTGVGAPNGLRLLNPSTEYASSIDPAVDTAGSSRNINLSSAATVNNAATAINALRLDTGGAVGGTGTLTVKSGAVLALPGNSGISVNQLNFGTQPAIISTIGDLNISGTISGSGGLVKTGAGTLSLSSAAPEAYTGTTVINQGTIQLSATNQLPGKSFLSLTGGSLNLNGFNQTLPALRSGSQAGWSSSIYNPSNRPFVTLTVGPTSGPFNGTFGGAGGNNLGLTMDLGGANMQLANSSTYTGPTTLMNGGLILEFASSGVSANIVPASSHFMDGGLVQFDVSSTSAVQSFNGVTVNPGALEMIEHGPTQANLNDITRTAGATMNLLQPTALNGTFTTTSTNTNGILGGYLTLNSTDWASASSTGTIVPATYTNDTWTPGANVTVTTNSTQTSATANSLRFNAPSNLTVTLVGTNVLTSGGILMGLGAAAATSKITGGTLVPGAGHELMVHHWDNGTNANLEIDSVIADNGAPTTLTVAGGLVTATADNTYTGPTYLNGGQLAISRDSNLGDPATAAPMYLTGGTLNATATLSLDNNGSNPRPIVVNSSSGGITVSSLQTLTIPGVVSGPANSLSIRGSGTLLLSGANTFAGTMSVSQVTLRLGNALAAQNMSLNLLTLSATGLTFNPGIGTFYAGSISGGGSANLQDTNNQPVNLIDGNDNRDSTFSGTLGGSGNFIKTGSGTLTLKGSGNYTGTTTIDGGTVVVASSTAIPQTPNIRATAGPVMNNASLVFAANSGAAGISGTGTTTVNSGFTLTVPQISQAGGVMNNGSLDIGNSSTPAPASVLGGITGSGNLTIGFVGSSTTTIGSVQLTSGSGQSTQSALTINAGSTLDVTNNSFDIHYGAGTSPDSTIRSLIISGFNGGKWTGTGITSSTVATDTIHHAVGYADGADNVVAGLAAGDELIKYTFAGDSNLDGKVDVSDLGILATNYGHLTGQRWDQGDFTYDGGVDVSDLGVLATNYGAGTGLSGAAAAAQFQQDLAEVEAENPAFAAAVGASPVPEPAGVSLITVSVVGLLGRQRRKKSRRRGF